MEGTPAKWYRRVRGSICLMTDAVASLGFASLSHAAAQAKLTSMRGIRTSWFSVSATQPCSVATAPRKLQQEHNQLLTAFTQLLVVLVPQLDRLGTQLNCESACIIGTVEEELFWELWSFLAAASLSFRTAVYIMTDSWPVEQQPSKAELFNALQDLLIWVLSMSRSPAWRLMQPQHGRKHRNRELVVILSSLTKCILNIKSAPDFGNPFLMQHLSPSFIPILCCIVSEQFVQCRLLVPQLQETSRSCATTYGLRLGTPAEACRYCNYSFPYQLYPFMSDMVRLLSLFISNDPETGVSCFPFLTSPAVIQLLKTIVLLPEEPPPATQLNLSRYCMFCLEVLLKQVNLEPASEQLREQPSILQAAAIQHANSIPLRLTPFVSVSDLETDARLLQFLSRHINEDKSMLTTCYHLQAIIASNWFDFGLSGLTTVAAATTADPQATAAGADPARAAAVANDIIFRSIVALAKHSMLHGLRFMRHHNPAQMGTGHTHMAWQLQGNERLANEAMHRQREVCSVSYASLDGWDALCMNLTKEMVTVISTFRANFPRPLESGKNAWNVIIERGFINTCLASTTNRLQQESNIRFWWKWFWDLSLQIMYWWFKMTANLKFSSNICRVCSLDHRALCMFHARVIW